MSLRTATHAPVVPCAIILAGACIAVLAAAAHSDELHSKNSVANKQYSTKNYEQALKDYDNLILEYPGEPKLKMNKGSALYRLGQYDKAEEAYNQAKETKDKRALSSLYYNLGNALYMQGEQLSAQNNQQAMDKYKGALENYIKSLDVQPSDKDSKWNVQLVQKKIKQMQQQQQQNDQNGSNIEPSEYAKKMKALADDEVARKNYKGAFQIMNDCLQKDKTAAAYNDYIKRLKDVVEIVGN
jgi:tetratricopeptide (TPR) repeat protein